MERTEKIVILGAYRPFLRLMQVYHLKSFQASNPKRLFNVFRAFGLTGVMLIYAGIFLTMELLACIENQFDFRMITLQLAMFIGSIQVFNIYFILLWKYDDIIDIFNHLRETVRESMNF